MTEVVAHRSKAFVYPVIAGVGWEGGFFSTEVPGPKDEKELREERERLEREAQEALEARQREEIEAELAEMDENGGWHLRLAYQGPLILLANDGNGAPKRERPYRFNECHFKGGSELPFGPDGKRVVPNGASQQCHGTYEEHNGNYHLTWLMPYMKCSCTGGMNGSGSTKNRSARPRGGQTSLCSLNATVHL